MKQTKALYSHFSVVCLTISVQGWSLEIQYFHLKHRRYNHCIICNVSYLPYPSSNVLDRRSFSFHYEGRPIDLHHDQEYLYDLYF
jgi:hypothetical protein